MTYDDFWRPLRAVYDAREAQAVARLVLEQRYGLTLADMLGGAVERLAHEELHQLRQRLLTSEPVQYVLGEADFCGRRFRVAPGVLIPRPETEALCRLILSTAAPTVENGSTVLDIGTGSGCIAVTLAAELPRARVTAWDLSATALDTARQNARRLGVSITLELRDALALPTDQDGEQWDLIVSNPPYVCESERAAMAPNVLEHEPELALFVPDDDPLCFYRAIGSFAGTALKPGGHLFFEINERLGHETKDLLATQGFTQILIHQDPFGKDRFISACR